MLLGRGTGKGAGVKHRNTVPTSWCLCEHHWTLYAHTSVFPYTSGVPRDEIKPWVYSFLPPLHHPSKQVKKGGKEECGT